MSLRSAIDELSHRWQEAPTPTRCAALVDALAKSGDFVAARRLLAEVSGRYPTFVPLALARARLVLVTGDRVALRAALRAALTLEPEHPATIEMVHTHCPDLILGQDDPDTLVFAADQEVTELRSELVSAGASLVTESLADLYRRQGHLEAARQAYAELLAREPENRSLVERHQAVQEELAASRPMPFDARESGGTPVKDWLAKIARHVPVDRRRARTSYDDFFEAPPAPPSATADFDAFERWLKELAR